MEFRKFDATNWMGCVELWTEKDSYVASNL